ncbi:protein SMG7 isoform X1 [Argonauta hians]
MSTAPQVLRQAEALKATVADPSKNVSEVWVSRQKLEDLYKKLLIMDLEYALDKKVEQDLWNHAFKNQINTLQTQAKNNQVRNPKRLEVQASLNLFLETASGFYLQLLQLLCTTFKLDLPFRRKSSAYGIIKEKNPLKAKITPPKKNSCFYICQHCLVHLGDIARYRQEVDQAQTYYWHAANLVPSNGQPYNQLAILEAARGNKLTTVFYYIRSLAVRHPFPVAATNLEKFYTKLAKDSTDFKGKLSMSELITAFLQFHALIHLKADYDRAACLSEKLLTSLPAHVTSQSFSTPMLIQIIAINLFTMHHTKRQISDALFESGSQPDRQDVDYSKVDQEKGFEMAFNFTVLLLDILLHYTPKQEQKLRDFFTLPAIKILLDWLWSDPVYFSNNFLKASSVWSNLSKLLNMVQEQPLNGEYLDLSQYFDVPLPEDYDLRCFQPIEKAHSNYSFDAETVPAEIEIQLRVLRLINHGKWIVEKCSDLRLLSMQVTKSGWLNFQSPGGHHHHQPPTITTHYRPAYIHTVADGKENKGDPGHCNVDKQSSRQNVAIQAIIQKQNQLPDKNSPDRELKNINKLIKLPSMESKVCAINPHHYLLGVPTSDPQFMKPTGGATGTRPPQPPLSSSPSSSSSSKANAPSPLPLDLPSPTAPSYLGPATPPFPSHMAAALRQQQQSFSPFPPPPAAPTRRGVGLGGGGGGSVPPPPFLPAQIQSGLSERFPSSASSSPPYTTATANQPPPATAAPGIVRPPQLPSAQSFLSHPPPPSHHHPHAHLQHAHHHPHTHHQFLNFPNQSSTPPPVPAQPPPSQSSQAPPPLHYPPQQAFGPSSEPQLKGQKAPTSQNPSQQQQQQQSSSSSGGGGGGGVVVAQNHVHHQQQHHHHHHHHHPDAPLNKTLLSSLSQSLALSLAANAAPDACSSSPPTTAAPTVTTAGSSTEDVDHSSTSTSAVDLQHSADLQQACDDFAADPSDILGGFSHLMAIQPPKPSQLDFLASSKPFQGHAEGVPKPDSPLAVSDKSLLGTEGECLSGPSHELNSQSGTYSLFSSSPWSVHITAAGDSKSLGSSPFSSQASSIRNSPDPLSETYCTEASLVTPAFAPGFGFSFSSPPTDHWGSSPTPPPNTTAAAATATTTTTASQQPPPPTPLHTNQMGGGGGGGSGGGGSSGSGGGGGASSYLFQGNLQSLWSIAGPSPLKKLLEVQKQQRQNDPH